MVSPNGRSEMTVGTPATVLAVDLDPPCSWNRAGPGANNEQPSSLLKRAMGYRFHHCWKQMVSGIIIVRGAVPLLPSCCVHLSGKYSVLRHTVIQKQVDTTQVQMGFLFSTNWWVLKQICKQCSVYYVENAAFLFLYAQLSTLCTMTWKPPEVAERLCMFVMPQTHSCLLLLLVHIVWLDLWTAFFLTECLPFFLFYLNWVKTTHCFFG